MFFIEINDTINRITSIFYRAGIWRKDGKTAVYSYVPQLIHFILYASFPISMVFGVYQSDNMDESIFLAAEGLATVVQTVKLGNVIWQKSKICEFLQDIGSHSVDDCEEYIRVNKTLNAFMKFVQFFLWTVLFGGAFLIISSLPIVSDKKKLPFNVGFPIDWKNSNIAYLITFSYVTFEIIFSIICTLINIIIWFLMLNYSVELRILGSQFKNMGMRNAIVTSNRKVKISLIENQNNFLQDLISLIKVHRNIQKKIDRFKSCFSNLFLTQIITSGICICGSVYILAFNSNENLLLSSTYVTLLFYNIFDIFMIMYFGNEIKYSSDHLYYCLFESNWIDQSESCKRHIIILTEVLQQPQELIIYKLYPLNLSTFTTILSISYKMFNILQSLK